MDTQMKDAAWLAWIEQLAVAPAGHDRGNELPRSLFHCRLDDQPDHLVPAHLLRPEHWEVLTDRPLFVNPDCVFTSDGELPADAQTAGFANQDPIARGEIVWIRDPANDALQPFWLGPELSTMLSGAQPGDPAPSTLSPQARRNLIMANLLVLDDYPSHRRQQWAEIVSVTGAQFQQQGYAPVGRLIHPFHLAALRRYYRHQLRTGKLHLGDGQSPLRYIAYNDPVARFFHQQLTAAVTAFAGEPVKPSYVYLAAYQPGAILEKHTDREQCEFSVTLCLDYSPEPRNAAPWPLHLHKKSGKVTVFQAISDALLYRGCQLPHSREALPEGHTSTSIFFHYVREDFTGSLD
jgi:hypothetical protein